MNVPQKKRQFTGIVVSDKMRKTVVVRVDRLKKHPKYERRYTISRGFKAHDEKGEFKIGDKVVIEETRPLSKEKRWRVVQKIGEGRVTQTESSGEETTGAIT